MAPSAEQAFLHALPAIPRDAVPSQLFRRVAKVGQGAFGSVYRAEHGPTGFVLALKVIDLDTQDDDTAEIQREVGMLRSMARRADANVTRYFGCWLEGAKVWIAMDYADGGSVRTLRKAGPIEERFIVLIAREVLAALSFLNRMGIIHRDIKAANILLNSQPRVTLCDFGVSAPLFLSSSNTSKRTTFIGTPYWMAPEVIQGQPYDTKADIWGLGITVLEVADENGEPPLAREDPMRAIMMIPQQKPPRLPDGGGWSREMREFVAGCLNEKPDERLSADDLLKTKWIKAAAKQPLTPLKELLKRMDAWRDKGNRRTSLAMSLYGDDGAQEDPEFGLDGDGADDSWSFNTFRPGEDGASSSEPPASSPAAATPSTAANRTAPRSLRHLFDDVDAPSPPPDPFRAGPANGGMSPSPSGLLNGASAAGASHGESTAESWTSTIRPRAMTGGLGEGHGAGTRRPVLQRGRSNTATSFSAVPSALGGSNSAPAGPATVESATPTSRDVRHSKHLPTITIPSPSSFNLAGQSASSPVDAFSPAATVQHGRSHKASRSIDSNLSSASSSPKRNDRRLSPLEPPPVPPGMLRSGSESSLRGLPGSRRPSIARQASITVMETPAAGGTPAMPSPVPRPAVSRNNTALVTTGATGAASRQRSMSRGEQSADGAGGGSFDRGGLASPYPMPPPTPTSGLPPPPPPPPPASSGRFTPHLTPAGSGLKDVLKMAPMPASGSGDLLPPSPSVHSAGSRFNFLPLPSPLSHSHSHSNLQAAAAGAAPPMGASPSSHGSAGHVHFGRPASPPLSHPPATAAGGGAAAAHRRQASHDAGGVTAAVVVADGYPPPRALDYARLATAADVHVELERTAAELGQWLDLIDVGLAGMLYDPQLPPADTTTPAPAGGRPSTASGIAGE